MSSLQEALPAVAQTKRFVLATGFRNQSFTLHLIFLQSTLRDQCFHRMVQTFIHHFPKQKLLVLTISINRFTYKSFRSLVELLLSNIHYSAKEYRIPERLNSPSINAKYLKKRTHLNVLQMLKQFCAHDAIYQKVLMETVIIVFFLANGQKVACYFPRSA